MKLDFLKEFDFFTGVPDSLLSPLCNYLISTYGISNSHIIAANEGNCVAIAAGYHLATGKIPVVYLQNSGIGNIINPAVSLLSDKIYGLPVLFIIGWRGEPGVHDEPQHIFQGETTLRLLEDAGIMAFVIRENTTRDEVDNVLEKEFRPGFSQGKSAAFVVCKNALEYESKVEYHNESVMLREEIIRHILAVSQDDIVISTTGKTSRELFEIRESNCQSHMYDFLTVGSMGHSSSIALGIALQKPERKIWCLDGDGAALMHMGAMALIGVNAPANMVHIIINNGAHESVGGMPTVASQISFQKIAEGCGYKYCASVISFDALDLELKAAKERSVLSMLEVKCAIGARKDLGRPTTTAMENKNIFMTHIRSD